MRSKGQSSIKDFIIMSGGSFLNLIIGVFTTPIITRLVDPDEYGQLSIFNLYVNIAVLVFCVGLDQALVRFYYRSDKIEYRSALVKKCWTVPIVLWCSFYIGFLVLLFCGIVKFEFDNFVAIVLAICVGVQIVNRIAMLVLRLEYKSAKYTLVNIINKISYTVLAIALIKAINHSYLYILTVCTTLSYSITMVLSICFERKIWKSEQKTSNNLDMMQLLKYGAPFILSMGLTTLFQGIDKMSLNHYCSYAEVGIYSSAMSLVHVFAILQSSFNAIWAPMATEHYETAPNEKNFYRKGNAYITILMFVFGLSLILVKDVFAILLGPKYREAAYILPCLCFNPIMYTISETTVSGINFSQKSHLHIWIALGACLVNFIGNTIMVPQIGGKGAAISTGFSYIVFFALRTYFSNKNYKVDYQVGKLSVVTLFGFLYALYNTFVPFNILSIIGFVVCLLVLLVLYRDDFVDCIHYTVRVVKTRFLRKTGENG